MKTSRVWAATGILLTSLISGAANAQNPNFNFANNTAFTVYSVHFWPTVSDYRGPDRLGDDTIESGETHAFEPLDGGCVYNIRITLRNSDYEKQWNNIDLCQLRTFTLNYSYLTRTMWASKE